MGDDADSDPDNYEYDGEDDDYGEDDDDDYAFDDTCSYDDELETTDVKTTSSSTAIAAGDDDDEHHPSYVVLTEAAVLARQESETSKIAEILSIPLGFAAVLLRHYKWNAGRLQDDWFSDDGATARAAAGLLPSSEPTLLSQSEQCCGICFAQHGAGETRSASCGAHFYCGDCWRAFLAAAVDGGARCLSLRCPDPSCAAPVVRELFAAAALPADLDRYDRLALRSFVAASNSGERIRWCPGAGCTRAVELVDGNGGGGGGRVNVDVVCECRCGFCMGCGEEAHRPVSCETVRAWLDKNASYSETSNWVLANTRHCPRCRTPLEKTQGCMHMTCPPPCAHEFCWVCLDPWYHHTKCGAGFITGGASGDNNNAAAVDDDNVDDDDADDGVVVDSRSRPVPQQQRSQQSKSKAGMDDMDRYVYHYERWAANYSSLESVHKDTAELEGDGGGYERMAAVAGLPAASFGFLGKAYEQIARGRRVLKWAHAYGYYLLDPTGGGEAEAAKRALFEDLLEQANAWLERLHDAAELERRELFCSGAEPGVVRDLLKYYRDKVERYTAATRTFMTNLVKAFETTDLPEFKSLNK